MKNGNITLTYTATDGLTRHACNWNADDGEVVDSGPTSDLHEARRGAFDFTLDNNLRPCCQATYRRMQS